MDAAYTHLEPLHNVAYVYDGTPEGLLSAVFTAYAHHEDPGDVVRTGLLQPRLDQSVRDVETDLEHARRVEAGLRRECGDEAFEAVLHAALSDDPAAGTAVYRFVRHALPPRPAAAVAHPLRDVVHPAVSPVLALERAVMNERHRMMQFLRFEHLEGGVWLARCSPSANVVPLLMGWFSARFNDQPFIIHDEAHALAGVYAHDDWRLVRTDALNLPAQACEEALMQAAWKRFYDTVAVEERHNPELRRQFMPKRLWRDILEVRDELPGKEIERSSTRPTQ